MTLEKVPFARLLGIELESQEPGHAVMTLKIREEHKQNHGVVHGGGVAALIDSAMALAIMPLLGENERTTTVDLTIHYLRPLTEGTARASARVVRAGRRVITVSAELFDHQGKLAATGISTYLRLLSNDNTNYPAKN
jgi:uncharacterized protein (TIGR00369 family)